MDCLVTKLKGTVSDTDLLKLGELRLDFRNDGGWEQLQKGFSIKTEKECALTIIGTGNFTDSTYSANNGKSIAINANTGTTVYVSGDTDGFISIPDKYGLLEINLNKGDAKTNKVNFYGGLSALEYCNKLERLYLTNLNYVEGDIKYLSGKPLISVEINSKLIHGDIGCFKGCTSLYDCIFSGFSIPLYGNIENLSECSELRRLMLHNKNIVGDIASLPDSLTSLDLNMCGVSGDVSSLNNYRLTNLITINTQVIGSINGLKCPLKHMEVDGVTGSIESFVSTQRSAGRTTGTLQLLLSVNSNITFKSTALSAGTHEVSWTSSQITVDEDILTV